MKQPIHGIIFSLTLMLAISKPLEGQTYSPGIDYNYKTHVAPAFFGPNAFQIPDIPEGLVSSNFKIEAAADYTNGRCGSTDKTSDIFIKFQTPLFSDRVNLSLWWTVREWYEMSRDVMDYRRIIDGIDGKSNCPGALFISTDILAVRETEFIPMVIARIALRTSTDSNSSYFAARQYDSAGYFFDISAGKGIGDFRITASAGFLCWQTSVARQNDAIMYGIKASYNRPCFRISSQLGGYYGWEDCGDQPVSIRIRGDLGPHKWLLRPYFEFQHGISDWPFDQYRLGMIIFGK